MENAEAASPHMVKVVKAAVKPCADILFNVVEDVYNEKVLSYCRVCSCELSTVMELS